MNVDVLLFRNFETLDAFGPVEILGSVPGFSVRCVSPNGGMVVSVQGVRVWTEPLGTGSEPEVLLVPGGMGTRALVGDAAYLAGLKDVAERSAHVLTVCTGSALLAATGLLDGLRATSNKRAFDWVVSVNPSVRWVSCARWVVDGKFYTSSGVSAGMDMALGFLEDRLGRAEAEAAARRIEYVRNADRDEDPFAR